MAPRAIWKAAIVLGEVRVPVKLYSAVQDVRVHFRLLHADDLAPVTARMVDPASGRAVPRDEIRRGLEIDEGVFVVLTDEERRALEPPPSREIHVEQVVEAAAIEPRWLDRPYLLGPDGDDDAYFALVSELDAGGLAAVARWVMRKRTTHGVVQAAGGALMLVTLHYAEQIVPLDRIRPEPARAPEPRELKLAEQLVSALEGPFDPADYHDETQQRLRALIEAKQRGEELEAAPAEAPVEPAASLADALQASLRAGQEAARAG